MKKGLQILNSGVAPFLRLFEEASGLSKRVSVLFLGFALASLSLRGQDCGCDHVIKPGDQTYIDGKKLGVGPGDVVCLQAGNYPYFHLYNFVGSASAPIVLKNCGGVVKVGDAKLGFGFLIQNSKFFRLTGSGHSGEQYGIKVHKTLTGASGLIIEKQSSDFEVDHVETYDIGYAGVVVKQDPVCGNSASYNFTMKNVKLHDLYVHDVKGEAFYVGYSHKSKDCSGGKIYPHKLHGLRIYDNRIEDVGRDGIQVSRADQDCRIYNNYLKNYGTTKEDYHSAGILIGEETTGHLYNNWIEGGSGQAIQVFGPGDNFIYNNVILNSGKDAILCADRITLPGKGFHFINNTIVNPGGDGIVMYSTQSRGNVFYNNLIVNPKSKGQYGDAGKSYINMYKSGVDYKASNNHYASSLSDVKFKDASGRDFHLQSSSPATSKGRDVSSLGVTKDFEGTSRTGQTYDIGAYAYADESTDQTSNKAPTVDAGSDKAITLPSDNVTLSASAVDDDGTIAAYAWTNESGGSITMENADSQEVIVRNLEAGVFVFSVTVTDNEGAASSDQVKIVVNEAPPASPPSPAPSPSPSSKLQPGLHYSYYEGKWNQLPQFSALEAKQEGTIANVDLSPRLRNSSFGFVYKGYINIVTPGTYTFYTTSDDGSQLFINDEMIVDNDGLHGKQEKSGSVSLASGKHSIRITYFEKAGNEVLETKYQGPGIDKQAIPESTLFSEATLSEPSNDAAAEISYHYFEGTWSSLPDFHTMAPEKIGVASDFSLIERNRDDNFGYLYFGYIDIPQEGQYTFETRSDDGSTLHIGGTTNEYLVVDNDGLHGAAFEEGTIHLSQGKHPFVLSYFERGGDQVLEVYWKNTAHGVNGRELIAMTYFSVMPEDSLPTAPQPEAPELSATDDVVLSTGQTEVLNFVGESVLDLTWSYDRLPTFVTVDELEGTLQLTLQPEATDVGNYDGVLVRVTDELGQVTTVDFSITVNPVIDPNLPIAYSYYQFENNWYTLPDLNTKSPVKTGYVSSIDLSMRERNYKFALLFSGYLEITQAGDYTFGIVSDDGSKLYIGDYDERALLIDNDGLHAAVAKEGTVYLEAGIHPIHVAYFDCNGDEELQLYWNPLGKGKEEIPASTFVTRDDFTAAEAESFQGDSELISVPNLYPNPFVDEITVEIEVEVETEAIIEIFDEAGVSYFQEDVQLKAGKNVWNKSLYPNISKAGVYILTISTPSGTGYTTRLVKK